MIKTASKQKISSTSLKRAAYRPRLIAILCIVLLAVIGVQAYMTKQLQQQVQALNNAQFAGRIIAAADNIVQPLPQDVHSGQVFIYQARFTLPTPPAELGPLFYSFSQDKPSDAFISLGSKSDTDQAKQSILNRTSSLNDMFDAVPRLQACNNAVTIVYNQRHDGKAEGNKTLANGKTVYFYSNPGCANDGLLRYAKQIDSY